MIPIFFVPKEPLHPANQKVLNFSYEDWGVEHQVMAVYKHNLRYRLLKPCKVIKLYHYHCSEIRPAGRRGNEPKKHKPRSKPTHKLQYVSICICATTEK